MPTCRIFSGTTDPAGVASDVETSEVARDPAREAGGESEHTGVVLDDLLGGLFGDAVADVLHGRRARRLWRRHMVACAWRWSPGVRRRRRWRHGTATLLPGCRVRLRRRLRPWSEPLEVVVRGVAAERDVRGWELLWLNPNLEIFSVNTNLGAFDWAVDGSYTMEIRRFIRDC